MKLFTGEEFAMKPLVVLTTGDRKTIDNEFSGIKMKSSTNRKHHQPNILGNSMDSAIDSTLRKKR